VSERGTLLHSTQRGRPKRTMVMPVFAGMTVPGRIDQQKG
jgi:hypothetical protein